MYKPIRWTVLIALLLVASPLAVRMAGHALARSGPGALPEAVLWDQPRDGSKQPYIDQEFPDYPTFSTFLGDDFVNSEVWDVSTIYVPGDLFGSGSLLNAQALTWQIYADGGGLPDGDPVSGGPVWSATMAPTDPRVTITAGSSGRPSNAMLSLEQALRLSPGTWWLVFFPTMDFTEYGQYGRQQAGTAHFSVGHAINPGGDQGFGTTWQKWGVLGATEQDIAFTIQGQVVLSGPSLHIASLSGRLQPNHPGGRSALVVDVQVHDGDHTPLGGVEVIGTVTWPRDNSASLTETSKRNNGTAHVRWSAVAPEGSWGFCVEDLVLAGYEYVPGDDDVSSVCQSWPSPGP